MYGGGGRGSNEADTGCDSQGMPDNLPAVKPKYQSPHHYRRGLSFSPGLVLNITLLLINNFLSAIIRIYD